MSIYDGEKLQRRVLLSLRWGIIFDRGKREGGGGLVSVGRLMIELADVLLVWTE